MCLDKSGTFSKTPVKLHLLSVFFNQTAKEWSINRGEYNLQCVVQRARSVSTFLSLIRSSGGLPAKI